MLLESFALDQSRYPHSTDIYTDETRFTPLGSDATVVYGYKDFRFLNHLPQPLCFRLFITNDRLIAQLWTPMPISRYHIEFRTQSFPDRTEVEAVRYPIDHLDSPIGTLTPTALTESIMISHTEAPESRAFTHGSMQSSNLQFLLPTLRVELVDRGKYRSG